jgi:CDP-diacylglycerol--glycerol-3-phosphate 3-phosphatidyltransferase
VRWRFFFVLGLTLIRVPLIFVFLGISIFCARPFSSVAFGIAFFSMILSAVTDLFDGYFARRFKVTSTLGSHADPLTDKIFYLTTFPTLVYLAAGEGNPTHTRVLLLLAVIFLLRDQWVSFLRSIGSLHNLDAKANWSGKARTIISFPTICAIFYEGQAPASWPRIFSLGMVYTLESISLLINLISIVVYTRNYAPALRAEFRPPPPGTQP